MSRVGFSPSSTPSHGEERRQGREERADGLYVHTGPSELKLSITITTDKTVRELKQAIAEKSDVEAERQRLIYSGAWRAHSYGTNADGVRKQDAY